MDVFLMIRRKKSTFFLDAKDNTTVLELKRMVEGITKKSPTEQRLYNKDDTVSLLVLFFRTLFSLKADKYITKILLFHIIFDLLRNLTKISIIELLF